MPSTRNLTIERVAHHPALGFQTIEARAIDAQRFGHAEFVTFRTNLKVGRVAPPAGSPRRGAHGVTRPTSAGWLRNSNPETRFREVPPEDNAVVAPVANSNWGAHGAAVISWVFFLIVCTLLSPVSDGQELFAEKSDTTPMEVERIYVRGLQYLIRSQNAEGHWPDRSYGSEPAVVGLAILSMLAHGDDPNLGPYSGAIRQGLEFILKQMNQQTGYIGRSMYNHGFASLALAEAYGAVDDPRLGPALEKSVSLILNAQSKNPFGGWRYSPESTDADTTVSGAQMVALFAARNAGIAVPEAAIKRGLTFFSSCQTSDGGYGYTPGTSANAARTAIGCVILALAKDKNSKAFQAASNFLKNSPPESSYYHYYLYYASQAFFHISPEMWQSWNRRNIKTLASTQNPDGSWDGQFGPTFATGASLLSLALNYRFLPIYER